MYDDDDECADVCSHLRRKRKWHQNNLPSRMSENRYSAAFARSLVGTEMCFY